MTRLRSSWRRSRRPSTTQHVDTWPAHCNSSQPLVEHKEALLGLPVATLSLSALFWVTWHKRAPNRTAYHLLPVADFVSHTRSSGAH